MTYTFNQPTGEIIDDDGQVVATLSDNALPEQGEALVRAYNSDNSKLEAMRKACLAVCKRYADELLKHEHGEPLSKVAEAIANSIRTLS